MRDRTDVVLHVGMGKTGTTTIQQLLRLSRAALAEQGVLYPTTPGPVRHKRFGLSFRADDELATMPAWRQLRADSPERFRRRFHRRLLAEIDTAGLPTVLFSDEALYGFARPTLERLRTFTDRLGGQVRVVVYLRRQDDHLVSYYQQLVKVGETQRLVDWAHKDRKNTYDYALRLARWQAGMPEARLVVRRFERSAFVDGSLEADFLDAAGLAEVPRPDLEPSNETFDAETVEFLRLCNLHEHEHPPAEGAGIDRRAVFARLAGQGTGPTLTLPTPSLDAFMERWEETNRVVAHEHFGEGTLFRDPRRTTGTTHVQHLDPARLDHYLELAGLTDELRDGLHRIAVREAARA